MDYVWIDTVAAHDLERNDLVNTDRGMLVVHDVDEDADNRVTISGMLADGKDEGEMYFFTVDDDEDIELMGVKW